MKKEMPPYFKEVFLLTYLSIKRLCIHSLSFMFFEAYLREREMGVFFISI